MRSHDPHLQGRCGQGYLWTALVPGQCMIYEWHTSPRRALPGLVVGTRLCREAAVRWLQCLSGLRERESDVALFGCWAHARRNFFEAQEQAPRVTGWILNQIGLLHRWEEDLRRNRAGPVLRQVQRSSHHRMVIERLSRALKKLRPEWRLDKA